MKRAATLAVSIGILSVFSSSMFPQSACAQFNWAQLPAMVDVSAREAQLDKDISESVSSGRLSAPKADEFRKELARIKQQETTYRADGKLSVWERMRLVVDLDQLEKNIVANLDQRTTGITDVAGREAEIGQMISEGLFSGRLSRLEADDFQKELDAIKSKETSFRQDGSLNSTELLTLSLDLDRLMHRVETQLRPRIVSDPQIGARYPEILKRVDELVAAGKMSGTEADGFRQEVERIKSREAAFRRDGRPLSTDEILTLALDLERLEGRLDRFAPSHSATASGIDARQTEIEQLISRAMATGHLSPYKVASLKQEFDRIARIEAGYRADGILTDAETLALARDLDQLKSHIESIVPSANLPGIDARLAEVKKHVSEAESAGRLNPQAARSIRADLSRIEDKWRVFKLDGQLNDSETLTLASDLDALDARLAQSKEPLPDVNAHRARLERRLNSAISSGRISTRDADTFKSDLERVSQLESTFQSSDGGLNDQEIAALSREFKVLNDRLDGTMAPLPDIASKRGDLQSQIDKGLAAGSISTAKAAEFRAELDRIASMEAKFRSSGNRMNDRETLRVADDLKKVEEDMKALVESAQPKVDVANAPPDVRGHWAESYIAMLSQKGTIGGFPDGSFRPNEPITRAQFAAIAVKALNLPPAGRPANFKDVSSRYWASNAIAAVSDAGLVTGFPDGSFRPEDKITRAQALVILSKALNNPSAATEVMNKFSDGNAVPTWALPSVAKAANAGIVVNHPDPSAIRPNDTATRAEIAALTYQTMSNLGQKLPSIRVGLEASGK